MCVLHWSQPNCPPKDLLQPKRSNQHLCRIGADVTSVGCCRDHTCHRASTRIFTALMLIPASRATKYTARSIETASVSLCHQRCCQLQGILRTPPPPLSQYRYLSGFGAHINCPASCSCYSIQREGIGILTAVVQVSTARYIETNASAIEPAPVLLLN